MVLCRAIYLLFSGNAILVTPVGYTKSACNLVRLCVELFGPTELTSYNVQSRSFDLFLDGLRSAVRLAGTEGRSLVIHLTVRNFVFTVSSNGCLQLLPACWVIV